MSHQTGVFETAEHGEARFGREARGIGRLRRAQMIAGAHAEQKPLQTVESFVHELGGMVHGRLMWLVATVNEQRSCPGGSWGFRVHRATAANAAVG